jgi:hypothetical protein
MTKNASDWIIVNDIDIVTVWKCPEDDCDGMAEVGPGFFEESGTPMCACDRDMIYLRTEVNPDFMKRSK